MSKAENSKGQEVRELRKLSADVVSHYKQKAAATLKHLGLTEVSSPLLYGARMINYIQSSKVLTQDPWILGVVEGKPIDWVSNPYQHKEPRELRFNQETSLAVDQEAQKMLEMNVIETFLDQQPQFISTLLLRNKKKKGGSD